MFGSETSYYKLGKYIANSIPVNPNEDWTDNFAKIDEAMSVNRTAINAIKQGVEQITNQSALLVSQIQNAERDMVNINADVTEINLRVTQASTLANNAVTVANSAKTESNNAIQSANTAKQKAGLAVSQNVTNADNISSLNARITALEEDN